MKKKATLLANVEIHTPHRHFPDGAILIEGEKIVHVGPIREASASIAQSKSISREFETVDLKGLTAVPGFIDIHLHGGGGADFMDANPASIERALRTHLIKGTTSVVPTLMTAAPEDILRAIEAVIKMPSAGLEIPEILGLHLEGPCLAGEKRGAQPEKHIRPFSSGELSRYIRASKGGIKIMTLAPEIPKAGPLIRYLLKNRIIAAAGHSNAAFAQAMAGLRAGISHGTHLFNAMSGLFHRDPGLAGALLLDDGVSIELIADGIHLHPAILSLVMKIKPLEKIILVTDATRRTGLSRTPLRTPDGRLYGSAITLDVALKNTVRWTGRPLAEILPMLTLNPARLLGVTGRKGRLAKGADADIVILDKKLSVTHVFRKGKKVL
jgi:N-acetylglucosamine-6-phosphate deacetylase